MIDFKQTEIGLMPDSWKVVTVSDVCEPPQYGFTDTSSKQGNAKFLRITDIKDFGVNWDTVPYCNCLDLNKHLLKENDIVIARIGATTGKSYIIKKPPVSLFASYLIRLRTKSGLNADYLFYFCNSSIYWHQINASKGNNLKKGISGSVLKTVKLPYPPLEEQRNIAHILSKIQSAIEAQEKIIQTTTELKKALMQKLFTEGLKGEAQKETEIGLVPKSWEIKKIRELVLETETRNPEKEPNKCIKYIDVSSVSNDTFSVICHQDFLGKDAPGRARKVVNTDDVIFATIRPTLKRVAKIMPEYDDQYCSTAFCVLRVGKNRLDFEYLYQYLLTDFFIKEIGKLQSGASYPAVRDDDVKRMKIPYPSIEEQEKISSILKQLDCKKAFAIKKSLLLQSLFKSMLHHLMTGQIRVKDLRFS